MKQQLLLNHLFALLLACFAPEAKCQVFEERYLSLDTGKLYLYSPVPESGSVIAAGRAFFSGLSEMPVLCKLDNQFNPVWAYEYDTLVSIGFDKLLKLNNGNYLAASHSGYAGNGILFSVFDGVGNNTISIEKNWGPGTFFGGMSGARDSGFFACWSSVDTLVLAKFNNQLQPVWSWLLQSPGRLNEARIATDEDNGIFMTAYNPFCGNDLVCMKFDSVGQLQWYHEYPTVLENARPVCWKNGYAAVGQYHYGDSTDITVYLMDSLGQNMNSFSLRDTADFYEVAAAALCNDTTLLISGSRSSLYSNSIYPCMARAGLTLSSGDTITSYLQWSSYSEYDDIGFESNTFISTGFMQGSNDCRIVKSDNIRNTCSGSVFPIAKHVFMPVVDTLVITESSLSLVFNPFIMTKTPVTIHVNTPCTVGINDPQTEQAALLQLYPNPAEGLLKIDAGALPQAGPAAMEVSIFNGKGQLVQKIQLQGRETELNVADYPAGLYLAQCTVDGTLLSQKFIVKH